MLNNQLFGQSFELSLNLTASPLARRETNDCVVKSFASAFEVPYEEAHEFVKVKFGRKNRQGTLGLGNKLRDWGDKSQVVLNGCKVCEVPAFNFYKNRGQTVRRQMTVGSAINTYSKGTYIVLVKGHAFTIKDGTVIGNFSDTRPKVRIQKLYKVGK